MALPLQPLFNKCLIELTDEYDGILKGDSKEDVQQGILRDYSAMADHLTTSTGYEIQHNPTGLLEGALGKTVYWEQYGESGNIIEKDGKKYALVPFYRLIAVENE